MPGEVGYSGIPELDAAIDEWLQADKSEFSRSDINDLVKAAKWDDLTALLCRGRLKFGTAGLRGPMRAGYICMNDLVVLQTAQGLCEYLKRAAPPEKLVNGIIIGYDGRHFSNRFAELTARVFTNSSIKVYLFSNVCPTPWIPFAIKTYNAAAGIMVTASHNPKEDNGYKVYWNNASQITSPHDKNIEMSILENLKIDDSLWDIEDIRSNPLVVDRLEEVTNEYSLRLHDDILEEDLEAISNAKFKFVYSAMHGVGFPYVERAFDLLGMQPLIPVFEQCDPDPNFPTVEFPNPEEPACLKMSIELAEQEDCTVVLANDPDADRLAVAELQKESGSWHIFTGNEIGSLLGWWMLRIFLQLRPTVDRQSIIMLSSAVSSKMLHAICSKFGATFIETLTGFKWMGSKAVELKKEKKYPIFAFEEAIGFMCSPEVPDKDGVSAAVQIASLCSYLKMNGKTLMDQLNWLYDEYGYHITDNSYFISHNPEMFRRIIKNLRNYDGTNTYPKELRYWKIIHVRDLGIAGDETAQTGTGLEQQLSSGEMLTFTFENGLVATIRTSGTEPKIKYYTELCAKPGQGDRQELKKLLKDMVTALIEDFIQPNLHNLIDRK